MLESDQQIVSELRSGNAGAFDDAYALHRSAIFSFLLRLCGSRALAEDLFQNTWLKLAKHATRLRPDTQLRAWLLTVARNEFRSHRRWQMVDLSRLLEMRSRPTPYVEAQAELNQEMRALETGMRALNDGDREVLLLVAVEGLEPRQAAEVLGISHAALRKRLGRARVRLEQRMSEVETSEAPIRC